LNISGLQYNLNRKTLEIYVSGCLGNCEGCHNKELWDFSLGRDCRNFLEKIEKRIKTGMVMSIWVLGGDPMDQNWVDLIDFLKKLKEYRKKIWLWTRYKKEDISDEILELIDYLKTGEYRHDLPGYTCPMTGIELASNNQKIHKLK